MIVTLSMLSLRPNGERHLLATVKSVASSTVSHGGESGGRRVRPDGPATTAEHAKPDLGKPVVTVSLTKHLQLRFRNQDVIQARYLVHDLVFLSSTITAAAIQCQHMNSCKPLIQNRSTPDLWQM